MKIITYKNNLITYEKLLKNAIEDNYIDGIIVPIIMTKDKKIVIFDDQITGISGLEILRGNTLKELQNNIVIELDNFLEKIAFFSKRIILNIYPLLQTALTNETIQYINKVNQQYINLINSIIMKHNNLNISLCSTNQELLYIIRNNLYNYPKGLILKENNLNYMDVDFYIMPPNMIDISIINQELNQNKEIMISSFTSNDLEIINEYFFKNKNYLKTQLLNKITFVSAYPDLLYQLFTK